MLPSKTRTKTHEAWRHGGWRDTGLSSSNSAIAIGYTVVNIGTQDLIEGRPHLLLELISQIIKDLLEALNQLEEGDNIKKLNSFDKFKQAILLGQLDWSPMHKDSLFWRDNVTNFEENDFKILRVLITILDTSTNLRTLAVACFNLSQFIYINGKPLADSTPLFQNPQIGPLSTLAVHLRFNGEVGRLVGTKHGVDGNVYNHNNNGSAKRFKAADIAPANATKEVYASIFTSSKKSDFKETYSCRSLPVGDDDFYNGSPFCSGDSGILLSIGFHVDIYCPARKRARISGPLVVEGSVYEDKRPSIDRLPDECLFEIFRHLPGGRERSASACVSKRWLTVLSGVRNAEFYRSKVPQGQPDDMNVDLASNNKESISADEDLEVECDGYLTRCVEGKKATDVRLAAIAVCTSSRGGLGKLSIRGYNSNRGVTDLGLSAIARACPSLRFLSLWNVPSIGDEGLFEIAREFHSLEKLDLCQCPSISNKSIVAIAKSCPNLTALTFESCLNIGNESLQAVGKYCPKLQSITIKDCPLVRDHGVASLLASASSLMKVKLQTLNISDCSLAVIGHYGKSITSLVLSGLQNVSQKGFWVMGNARGLQTLAYLAITSCRGVIDLSLEALEKGCPNLKQMCIRKCFFVSDNGLVAFAKCVIIY
ncbi:unnamed protein product [Fraxinus pennsylvanica]|uniref:F-box domain-containing protein n=1 Tax=Fraxinus pennsylvanica TaxID=56036 RepID=A0AAD1Z0D2_9LAMI|nr:unnamed protein product [Fraxinus pennsylvanica]